MFEPDFLDKLAKETGVVQRKRKLSASVLLDTLLFAGLHSKEQSLNDLALDLLVEHDQLISKQALDKKFTEKTVIFLQKVLDQLLVKGMSIRHNTSNSDQLICSLKVKDSTKFILPEQLQQELPGTKGRSGAAMASIQLEIDLINQQIESLSLNPGNHNDQRESLNDMSSFKPKSLYIRDLGYVSIPYLKSIEDSGSYYVNRLLPKTYLFSKAHSGFKKVDWNELRKRLRVGDVISQKMYLGAEKYPARVIISRVPKEVQEQRLRKLNAYNKRKGHQTSDEYKLRSEFNILVSNLPESTEAESIEKLYRLRWQIELIFKGWKSSLRLAEVKNCKKERVLSMLYSKLILGVLHWIISFSILSPEKSVSILKVYKVIVGTLTVLRKFIFRKDRKWLTLISKIGPRLLERENRQGRVRVEETFKTLNTSW